MDLLNLLFYLVLAAVVLCVGWYVVALMPLPAPFGQLLFLLLVVVVVIYVARRVARGGPPL